jgi:CRP-like cAMP-binding protein
MFAREPLIGLCTRILIILYEPENNLSHAKNHLLELLPRNQRSSFLALCDTVPLTLTQVLLQPGEIARHVLFPVHGFVSQLAVIGDQEALEVGMVGREGMVGAYLALGVSCSATRAVVQGPGEALRMGAAMFKKQLQGSPALTRIIHRYLYVGMAQQARGAACLHYHLISARLARWFLMSQDRAHANQFHMTHEFLAYMLGVRRVGITAAAGALQRSGAIEYHRGELMVLNRKLLEQAACGCYAADEKMYADNMTKTSRSAKADAWAN